MKFRISDPVIYGVAVFIFVMVILMYARPACMFDPSGRMRPFTGENGTYVTALAFATVAGLLGYFVFYGR
jgi:hypothetical protein